MLLFLSMCNYSICAVYKGLFPLSVLYLFILGGTIFQYSNHWCLPSLSWQRVVLACATATGGARWTKMAGTVFASRGGEAQAVMWPWRLCAQTARIMKEVRNTEHEHKHVPEPRFISYSEYIVVWCQKKSDPHRLHWLKNIRVLVEWFCSPFFLKQMQDDYHSGEKAR